MIWEGIYIRGSNGKVFRKWKEATNSHLIPVTAALLVSRSHVTPAPSALLLTGPGVLLPAGGAGSPGDSLLTAPAPSSSMTPLPELVRRMKTLSRDLSLNTRFRCLDGDCLPSTREESLSSAKTAGRAAADRSSVGESRGGTARPHDPERSSSGHGAAWGCRAALGGGRVWGRRGERAGRGASGALCPGEEGPTACRRP